MFLSRSPSARRADQSPLDELRCHGAAAIISNIAGRAADATGPDGELVNVADSRVAAHPGGVEVGVVIDLRHAAVPVGEMVADLVAQILVASPALADWTIDTVITEELPAPAATAPRRPRGTRRPRARPGRR